MPVKYLTSRFIYDNIFRCAGKSAISFIFQSILIWKIKHMIKPYSGKDLKKKKKTNASEKYFKQLLFSQTSYFFLSFLFFVTPTGQSVVIAALISFVLNFGTAIILRITHALVPQFVLWVILFVCVKYGAVPMDVAIAIVSGWFAHVGVDMFANKEVELDLEDLKKINKDEKKTNNGIHG